MTVPFVDLHAQYLSIKNEIDSAIREVIARSAFIRGEFVGRFELEYAAAVGVKHCVSCGNGTDALYVLMKGLRLKPGDEVLTTAHSWISTSETITQAGGQVVFCDTDPETFTLAPERLAEKITPRTVGIVPVHLFGQPADMDPILQIAARHGLWVIEDCAQAHMAVYKGRRVGTMGTAAAFSFYPSKNLGAMGDAGCLVTNDGDLAQWCESYARHGGKGDHRIEGINSRLDGLQAAVLLAKLPHLEEWTRARQRVAALYDRLLADLDDVRTPPVADGRSHVFHLYVIRTRQRDALRAYLAERGIETVLNYPKALPFYPAYAHLHHTERDFPVAARHQNEVLSLPMYPELTEEQVSSVVSQVSGFFRDCRGR